MNNWTLHRAIKNLKDDEELYIRFNDEKHSFTFTKEDTSKLCFRNNIYIQTKSIWLDCDQICLMKKRERG